MELRLPVSVEDRERRTAIAAAEAAWRRLDDVGLSFSGGSLARLVASPTLLSSEELLAVLPGRDGGLQDALAPASGPIGIPLGRTSAGTVVSAPIEAGQGRHLAILGETGMGKSSLMVALAVRAAERGGIVVLDPLGETAREIRAELGPENDRVRFVSAAAKDAPTLNALDGCGVGTDVDTVRSERRIADIVHALRRVRSGRYADSSFWGPRLEEMMTRAVRAASAFPDGSLEDAHTLLSTYGLTRRAAPPASEEPLRELAQRIRERPEDADGARRLLHEVVRNPTLARMLCARRPTIRAADFVAPGEILLVSGDAGEVGESTARYLIAVYLALVWSELLVGERPTKTFVFLDEAQWFAHESLGEMLRLARRRNVHTLLATQSVASLPESVAEAVWTNVADFVAFRGLPEEAREIGRTAPGVTAERLLALPRGRAVALIGKGRVVSWIRTVRIPPSPDRAPTRRPPVAKRGSGADEPSPILTAGCVGRTPSELGTPGALLEWLGERARSIEEGALLRVSLDELRRRSGGDADAVRRLGAELGRRGAIRRSERSPDGTVWWLQPALLPSGEAGPVRAGSGGSEKPQPS